MAVSHIPCIVSKHFASFKIAGPLLQENQDMTSENGFSYREEVEKKDETPIYPRDESLTFSTHQPISCTHEMMFF